MTTRAVHWHEGMFLRPHHFLAAQQYGSHQANLSEKWDLHYNWGLRSIQVNLDSLTNSRFVVGSLAARLRDGTLVAIPEDGVLPDLDLKAALAGRSEVTISLGLPLLQQGKANVASDGKVEGVRYLLDTLHLDDENTGVNAQPVKVRLLNFKLLLSSDDHAGYEVIPVARIKKSSGSEPAPQLDPTYIPPVLACDAWPWLSGRDGLLQVIYYRIGKKVEEQANQIAERGYSFDSQTQGVPMTFAQLRVLNEAYALLGTLVFAKGIHPLAAYLELCRLVGQLAIFGPTRRPPELPRYDHDDLGGCFYKVKQHIDGLLDNFIEPEYKERPFVGAGMRMQVSLEPKWVETAWEMFIGVQSPQNDEECIRLLTPGQLDMKVGSSDRVDTIFRQGQAGLSFAHCPRPPAALPKAPRQVFFQVNRESNAAEWQKIKQSLTLAIRLNENLVVGNIQGQQVLTIRAGGQNTTMQFTLYVVPRDRGEE
jgi:type VI secretion system protein ImpJ